MPVKQLQSRQSCLPGLFLHGVKSYAIMTQTDLYTGKVIKPGHIYEPGYRTCPKVLSEQVEAPAHCQCTRQSILYFLHQLEPASIFEVEILETVLQGSAHCRLRITKK